MFNKKILATPKVFQTKNKAVIKHPHGSITRIYNYVYKSKCFPPFVKEWYNSVYTFNKNTTILLPSLDENLFNLIKSYSNLYSLKFSRKIRSKRSRVRSNRSTTNRLITGKPDLKHTNDKVNIVMYTYDRRRIYYTKKVSRIPTLDLIVGKKAYTPFLRNLRGKNFELKSKIDRYTNTLLKKISLKNQMSLKHFGKAYFNDYIKKYMWKEIVSIRHRQSLMLDQCKYEKQYLLPLTNLLERMYNKKVLISIVNLKYFYNSCDIFSDALITKLKSRENKPAKILRVSLNTFNLPPVNRINIYNEMYNKEKLLQNPSIKSIVLKNNLSTIDTIYDKDLLDTSLCYNYNDLLYNSSKPKISTVNLNKVIESVKHKFTSGVRIEIAGRLTRRNTAARSLFKHRYKGNIKNIDSSHKGLSTVLLRGYAKANLSYNQFKSKLRIGAFGLKTWVSSN